MRFYAFCLQINWKLVWLCFLFTAWNECPKVVNYVVNFLGKLILYLAHPSLCFWITRKTDSSVSFLHSVHVRLLGGLPEWMVVLFNHGVHCTAKYGTQSNSTCHTRGTLAKKKESFSITMTWFFLQKGHLQLQKFFLVVLNRFRRRTLFIYRKCIDGLLHPPIGVLALKCWF
jgi:hypothetical protein